MAARDGTRYIQFPLDPGQCDALGIEPETAGVREVRQALDDLIRIRRGAGPLGIHQPIQIAAALQRYAAALSHARRRLSRVFDRAEWNYLADVMNGCLDLQDYGEGPISFGVLLMANARDGHDLDGSGYNHFERAEADNRVESMIRKLAKLSPIEADAVGVAIREFWARPDIDANVDEWWSAGDCRATPRGARRRRREAAHDDGL